MTDNSQVTVLTEEPSYKLVKSGFKQILKIQLLPTKLGPFKAQIVIAVNIISKNNRKIIYAKNFLYEVSGNVNQ